MPMRISLCAACYAHTSIHRFITFTHPIIYPSAYLQHPPCAAQFACALHSATSTSVLYSNTNQKHMRCSICIPEIPRYTFALNVDTPCKRVYLHRRCCIHVYIKTAHFHNRAYLHLRLHSESSRSLDRTRSFATTIVKACSMEKQSSKGERPIPCSRCQKFSMMQINICSNVAALDC